MRHPDHHDTRHHGFGPPADESMISASISALGSAVTAVIIICMIIAVYIAAEPREQQSTMPSFRHVAGE